MGLCVYGTSRRMIDMHAIFYEQLKRSPSIIGTREMRKSCSITVRNNMAKRIIDLIKEALKSVGKGQDASLRQPLVKLLLTTEIDHRQFNALIGIVTDCLYGLRFSSIARKLYII
jgi:hypothetical protein